MSRAAKSGFIAAAVHLLFVAAIAIAVASNPENGAELWVVAAFVDLPFYFLLGSILSYLDPPFIAAHDFLSALVIFAIAGSIQWWLIVYAVSRWRSHRRAGHQNI